MRQRMAVLLRGINLGPRRRVPMAQLRELLEEAGLRDVATYLQSGNVVLATELAPTALEAEMRGLISERFGFEVPVCVRSQAELAAVVKLNPLGEFVTEPKRYQVTFLSRELSDADVQRLQAAAADSERIVAHGRELYSWHPDGIGRSKLAGALTDRGSGANATARNWVTVTKLLEMTADGP